MTTWGTQYTSRQSHEFTVVKVPRNFRAPPLVLSLKDHTSPLRSKLRRRDWRRGRVTRPGREPRLPASLRPSESEARVYPSIKGDKNRPMVKSRLTGGYSSGDLTVIVRLALDSGMPGEDILNMVQTEVKGYETFHEPRFLGFESYDQETVFTEELPAGLIDVPTATKHYEIKPRTLHNWLSKGYITVRGRLKGPATGGGYLVIREQDLIDYMSAPRNKGGRPKKARHTI